VFESPISIKHVPTRTIHNNLNSRSCHLLQSSFANTATDRWQQFCNNFNYILPLFHSGIGILITNLLLFCSAYVVAIIFTAASSSAIFFTILESTSSCESWNLHSTLITIRVAFKHYNSRFSIFYRAIIITLLEAQQHLLFMLLFYPWWQY
jgi:hypothetical protein